MPTHPDHAVFPALLALDWGKTRASAYLLSPAGGIIETRSAAIGIQRIEGKRFLEALQALCGAWLSLYPQIPVIASGMLGSREGLRETAFASTPTNPAGLASKSVRIDDLAGRPFALIPGICDSQLGSPPDVIRGMETKILGVLESTGERNGIFVLPGTHCKWVKVKDGMIDSFRTYMTGELFSILRDHSILGRLNLYEKKVTPAGFLQGVHNAHEQGGNLTHLLFSVRTLGLTGQVTPEDLPGYLSGLLIGDEVADGLRWARGAMLTLIGSSELTQLYRRAFAESGHDIVVMPADIAAKGLHRLAQEINW